MITKQMNLHEALAVIGAVAIGEGIYKDRKIMIDGRQVFCGDACKVWDWLRANYNDRFDHEREG